MTRLLQAPLEAPCACTAWITDDTGEYELVMGDELRLRCYEVLDEERVTAPPAASQRRTGRKALPCGQNLVLDGYTRRAARVAFGADDAAALLRYAGHMRAAEAADVVGVPIKRLMDWVRRLGVRRWNAQLCAQLRGGRERDARLAARVFSSVEEFNRWSTTRVRSETGCGQAGPVHGVFYGAGAAGGRTCTA